MIDMFILIVVVVSCIYTYVKADQIVRFKNVQFIVCQLYLNKGAKNDYHQLESMLRLPFLLLSNFLQWGSPTAFLLPQANASCCVGLVVDSICLFLGIQWQIPASFCRFSSFQVVKQAQDSSEAAPMGNTNLGQLSVVVQLLCNCNLLLCCHGPLQSNASVFRFLRQKSDNQSTVPNLQKTDTKLSEWYP